MSASNLPLEPTTRNFDDLVNDLRAAVAQGERFPEIPEDEQDEISDYMISLPLDSNDRRLIMQALVQFGISESLLELRAAAAHGKPLPEIHGQDRAWLLNYRFCLHPDSNDFRLIMQALSKPHVPEPLREFRAVAAKGGPFREMSEEEGNELWEEAFRLDYRSGDDFRLIGQALIQIRVPKVLLELRAAAAQGEPFREMHHGERGKLRKCMSLVDPDSNDFRLIDYAIEEPRLANPKYANVVPAKRRPIENENCLICFVSFEGNNEEGLAWCKVGTCGKNFHMRCIRDWFHCCDQRSKIPTCPNCRKEWWFET